MRKISPSLWFPIQRFVGELDREQEGGNGVAVPCLPAPAGSPLSQSGADCCRAAPAGFVFAGAAPFGRFHPPEGGHMSEIETTNEVEVEEFTDELSDEALDREGGKLLCCSANLSFHGTGGASTRARN